MWRRRKVTDMKFTLSEIHAVEAKHLRDKLRIAMAALDVVIKFGHEAGDDFEQAVTDMTVAAERALERIEGDDD
jgi:hypothetical protein